MKKKTLLKYNFYVLIIICFILFIPVVNAATYQKKCSDYTYSNCPDGKTDERGNTCKAANNTCYFKVIKTTCQNVVPEACSEADGHCCGVDSAGNSCTYDINTKKCKNVATYNRKATCNDWTNDNCPAYSDDGTECRSYAGVCQPLNTVKKMEEEAKKISNDEENQTITEKGEIKAITCTGNSEDKIPARLPSFTRALYNVLKILVPLFIIFFGIFDFARAATSSNESNMDSYKHKFVRRIIAGILIFFVLAISQWVFGLVGEKDNVLGCVSCFLTTKSDCQEAGYIDPGKNDDNDEPNKTPPESTNKVSGTSSINENNSNNKNSKVTVDKILKEAKKVTDYVRINGFSYGNALKNPAMDSSEKKVSCDRCVGWVLYNLGYKKQPSYMGLVVKSTVPANDMSTFCKKNGFKKITNFSDVKAGDIIFQRAVGTTNNTISHVFILGNKKSNGNWERYDCGTDERIQSVQPIVTEMPKSRFLFAYRIAV